MERRNRSSESQESYKNSFEYGEMRKPDAVLAGVEEDQERKFYENQFRTFYGLESMGASQMQLGSSKGLTSNNSFQQDFQKAYRGTQSSSLAAKRYYKSSHQLQLDRVQESS